MQPADPATRGPGTQPAAAPPSRRPVTLAAAAAVEAAEAAGVLAATVLAGIDAATGQSYQTSSGVALTIIGAAAIALLGFVAAGLARARRWSRTPAVLTQLFTGMVSIYLVQGQRYYWGIPGLVLAVAGLALIFAPPSMRALTAGRPASPG